MILDSSVLIAAERKRFDLVRFLSEHPNEVFFITAITASELLHGCARADDPAIRERRTRFVEGLLQDYVALPFAIPEARTPQEHFCRGRTRAGISGKGSLYYCRRRFRQKKRRFPALKPFHCLLQLRHERDDI